MRCQRILITEDDPDVREVLSDALQLEGYHVDAVTNGQEALDFLEELDAHHHSEDVLVLLDLMMPVKSGWEFLEEKKATPSLTRHPVVVLSAIAAEESVRLENLKASETLKKPVDLETLLSTIERY